MFWLQLSNPKQQIAYLGVKYWARLYCPEVILGVYSADETEPKPEREINPAPAQRVSLKEIASDKPATSSQESATDINGLADDFRSRIDAVQDVDAAKAIRSDVESAKVTLGNAIYTELKNKAVARYYRVDHQNRVEAAINSLPNPDEPEASARFAEVERLLLAAKRHLGEELHDQFSITLIEMRPEYIAD